MTYLQVLQRLPNLKSMKLCIRLIVIMYIFENGRK
jgi:hypothetical protein